jgi:hypothetical protein
MYTAHQKVSGSEFQFKPLDVYAMLAVQHTRHVYDVLAVKTKQMSTMSWRKFGYDVVTVRTYRKGLIPYLPGQTE